MTWDVFGNQTDAWGYSRYSLAVHAPPDLHSRIMDFRAAIGLADLTSEPHVSISATMHQPVDMPTLQSHLRNMAQVAYPFRLLFSGAPEQRDGGLGWLPVQTTTELLQLRDQVMATTQGQIEAVVVPGRSYRPHVTLYQGASKDEATRANKILPTYDFGDGFDVASMELVGRVGPPRGGTREIITSFWLGPQ